VAWVDLTVVAVRAADGTIVRWLGCVADVTDQVDATAALRRSEQQFRLAMEHAPIGMALVDVDGRFLDVNRALCRIVGYDEEQLVGRTFQQITHPDDLAADLENVARLLDGTLDHYAMEKRFVTRDHDVVWVLLAVSLARDETGRPAYFVSQIQDVTASRAAQELLAHRALHDPLTGLANRDLLMDHLSHALARSARGGTSTAVMFCDLDRFKVVNDTYGHEAGDLLLVAVAERLRSVVRPGDTVARLGGDEFVVVAEGLPDADAVHALAERVRLCLHEPARIGSHIVNAGASIGVAVASAEDDARSVLREADAAMYRAKTLGRGRLEMAAMTGAAIGMVRKAGPVTELDLQGS
jgi:diguanylate cyclase (GGDEF)-like protein/PAS domain S-box-containing protein